MRNKTYIIAYIVFSLYSVFPLSLGAQNNKFQIDDRVYDYYQKSMQNRSNPSGKAYADSAIALSKKIKDDKAMCVSLSASLIYAMNNMEYEGVHKVAQSLRDFTAGTDYTQYYFHSYSQEIIYLLNNDMTLEALDVAEKMRVEAETSQDDYGIYLSLRSCANVYLSRHDDSNAVEYFRKAISHYWRSDNLAQTQSVSSSYEIIAEIYADKKDMADSASWYFQRALQYAKTSSDSLNAYRGICHNAAVAGDEQTFYEAYDRIKDDPNLQKVNTSAYAFIRIYDKLIHKRYDEALEQIKAIPNDADRLVYLHRLYKEMGEYKIADEINEERIKLLLEKNSEENQSKIAELVAKLGTEQIKLQAQQKQNEQMKTIIYLSALSVLILIGAICLYVVRKAKTARDLSEMNRELKIAKEKAESASKMKSLFVQNMSHEIRTPLNSIMGFSQLLTMPDMEWSEEEKSEYGKAIMTNGQMLQMLIDDILSISDLESGNYSINPALTDVREVCRAAADIVEYRIPGGVEFIKDFDSIPDSSAFVRTDAGRVQQILINFLTNACKHTRSGSITLACSLTETPDCFTFSVTDTGEGIPDDQAEEIFERFAKLNVFKQGTGLGLNICRTISELIGGKVVLDTTYKKGGARFLFILPVHNMESF